MMWRSMVTTTHLLYARCGRLFCTNVKNGNFLGKPKFLPDKANTSIYCFRKQKLLFGIVRSQSCYHYHMMQYTTYQIQPIVHHYRPSSLTYHKLKPNKISIGEGGRSTHSYSTKKTDNDNKLQSTYDIKRGLIPESDNSINKPSHLQEKRRSVPNEAIGPSSNISSSISPSLTNSSESKSINEQKLCNEKVSNVQDSESFKNDSICHSNVNDSSIQSSSSLSNASTTSSPNTSTSLVPTKLSPDEIPSGWIRYILFRYSIYLQRCQQTLENEMPDTFQMLRIFSVGLKKFIIDFRDLIGVLVQLGLPGVRRSSLCRRELELYHFMPGDMIRSLPVIVLSSAPFGQNIAFPIAYWFPKHLLSHHFWNIQQRYSYALQDLKKRLFNARPVFRCLQGLVETIEDKDLQDKCQNIYYKLGAGFHPTIEEILQVIPLFKGEPYEIINLKSNHLNTLLRLHGRSTLPVRAWRLIKHANMLHCLDMAILREDLSILSHHHLSMALYLRGVNPTGLTSEWMTRFMNDWLTISQQLDEDSYSLLLHLPIFLAYNHPTNLTLRSI